MCNIASPPLYKRISRIEINILCLEKKTSPFDVDERQQDAMVGDFTDDEGANNATKVDVCVFFFLHVSNTTKE